MKSKITFIIFAFATFYSFSQKRVADKFYKKYAYIKAAELYKEAVRKGDSSSYVLTKLGDCYYNNSNSKKAAFWYGLSVEKNNNLESEYIYKYVQSLKSIGEYKLANKWLQKIGGGKKDVLEVDYEKLRVYNKDSILIENLDLNTKYSDFGGYVHNNQLFFASTKNKNGKIYKWNNQPYLDLYQALIVKEEENTKMKNITPIASTEINTSFHESNVVITKDGKTMYFTRNNLTRRENLDYDKEGTSHLKIYKASLINNSWGNIEELPFNDAVFSNGHPALSPDDKTLYFTSNKPGGYGETDIYKVSILPNNKYGEPKNLGKDINTIGREMFPFVSEDNTFYFSSDGYPNLGFLDVYKSDFLKSNVTEVVNMGAPFNSGDDDFAFFINRDNKTGYFSSNRPQGKGDDDIYSFKTYNCKQFIEGKVFDSKTKEVLVNTLVQLIDNTGKVINQFTTKEDGFYSFTVECETKYSIRGSKIDYKDALENVTTTKTNKEKNIQDLYLIPLIIDEEIVINPIYFDFDKWNIRSDAAFELENIVDVLKNHLKMIIKIESHTDSRGGDEYNRVLSDRRAKSTREYILSRNINPVKIISAIGYGESQLINACNNKTKCSEEKHQENRRSKFIIISK